MESSGAGDRGRFGKMEGDVIMSDTEVWLSIAVTVLFLIGFGFWLGIAWERRESNRLSDRLMDIQIKLQHTQRKRDDLNDMLEGIRQQIGDMIELS